MTAARKPYRRGRFRIGDCRGGAAVEFALVLPFLLGLLYGAIELGRLFWDVAMLNFAVADAARCAVIDCSTLTAVQQTALGWGGLVIGPPDVQLSSFQLDKQDTVTPPLCPGGNITNVCVCTSPIFTTAVQGFLGASKVLSFPLSASSCYPAQ